MSGRFLKIGVSGGIGSGKSAVSAMLADLGAVVIDADAIAAAVLSEPAAADALAAAFGKGVLDDSGRPDRARTAKAAFASADAAKALNAVTHPMILERIRSAEKAAADIGAAAIVLDAPLLFEAGLDGECDVLVFVDAPAKTRMQRVAARGMHGKDWENRERAQGDLEEKRRLSSVVIDNSGPMEETRAQVETYFSRRLAPSNGGEKAPVPP